MPRHTNAVRLSVIDGATHVSPRDRDVAVMSNHNPPMNSQRVGRALLRGVVAGGLGFVVYAVVPLPTGALGLVDALVIAGGIAGFAVAVGAAAMRERRANITGGAVDADGARIEHIVAIVLWAVAFFALVYARLGAIPGEFEGLATRLDAMYFTLTTLTTAGFGDIHAVGQVARLVVVLQLIFDVVVLAVAARVLMSAVRRPAVRDGQEP